MESTCTPPSNHRASGPKASLHHFDKRASAALTSSNVALTFALLSRFEARVDAAPTEVDKEDAATGGGEPSFLGNECLAVPNKLP